MTGQGPPPLTSQQRQAASDRSAQARKRRAEFLARIRRDELTLADVFHIADEDPVLARIKISSVLQAFRGVTPDTATGFMLDARVNPSRRLRGVGVRQRTTLVQLIDL